MTAWVRWFAQPWALWLLLALPAMSLLSAWARWRRTQVMRQLGTSFLIDRLMLLRPHLRRWQSITLFLGVGALILAIAGPRWGMADQLDLLGGKDIVVVLDLSKSMLAEQPSRFERARRCLHDLADAVEARGGHRVALVVFAAHARLQFPLTSDYDHVHIALDELDPDNIAPALRPQSVDRIGSGTRIGTALSLAVAAHDPQRALLQDIILLSDGDDPASDEEWSQGVQAAHQRGLPIHVVAVGDPRDAHAIRQGSGFVQHDGKVVRTRLNEPLLQEIARRTNGFYFPAYQSSLPLGKLMRSYLEQAPSAPAAATDAQDKLLIQSQLQYAWFCGAALILLGASTIISAGPKRANKTQEAPAISVASARQGAATPSRWAVVMLLPLLLSAEPLPSVEDVVRLGNAAFTRQDFGDALKLYAQAAAATNDPGLIAFNQGAALYRLGRFAEAAAHYQRCLDDQAIPPNRLARANFDLGTALLRADNQNRRQLEQSIAAYRRCLDAGPPPDLQSDAIHNLELAKWLWSRAKPTQDTAPPNAPDGQAEPPTTPDQGREPSSQQADGQGQETEQGMPGKKGIETPGLDAKQKKLAHGPLQVLPDADTLTPLTPEEAMAHLERLAQRIQRDRRSAWRISATPPPHVKDW